MKLTIIVDDNAVYKDRVSFAPVDLSGVPSNVHALQFDTITSTGHIELKDGPNEMITTLPDWAVTSSTNYDTAVAAHNAAEAAKAAALFATKDQ